MAEGKRQDKAEGAEHGASDDGWSMPDELKETSRPHVPIGAILVCLFCYKKDVIEKGLPDLKF